jgi:hypothetical protein
MELNNSRDWYVVYSKRNKEEQAQFHLSTKGIESFFPRLLLSSGSKCKTRIVALFPNYLFVRRRSLVFCNRKLIAAGSFMRDRNLDVVRKSKSPAGHSMVCWALFRIHPTLEAG